MTFRRCPPLAAARPSASARPEGGRPAGPAEREPGGRPQAARPASAAPPAAAAGHDEALAVELASEFFPPFDAPFGEVDAAAEGGEHTDPSGRSSDKRSLSPGSDRS